MSQYIETYVGSDTLLTFRLTEEGLQKDVSSGYAFVLGVELDSDGTIPVATPIVVSSSETDADWPHGVVTVRLTETITAIPGRLNVSLVSTSGGKVITEDTTVVLILHKPGFA